MTSVEHRPLILRLIAKPEFGPLVLLVLELVVFWSINHAFLSALNVSNTLAFTVELGLIALAMTLLMTSGEFDLSVGSIFGFAPVVMWTLFNQGVVSLEIAFAIALIMAALIGWGIYELARRRSPESLLLPIGEVLAELVCEQDFSYVKACEGAACTLMFADRTRGRGRRWCSMSICGNRAKVAAHRKRAKDVAA